MLMLESGDWWRDWQVEILGSDINQRVLHTARKGVYKRGRSGPRPRNDKEVLH